MRIDPAKLFVLDALTSKSTEFLSGRTKLITEISNHLSGTNNSCVIHGERGVGKTTVAWQVASILEGKNSIFEREKIIKINSGKEIEFVFHKCSSDVKSVSDLLFNIVTDSSLKDSFANKYKEYLNESKITKLSHQFKFNFFSFFNYQAQIDEKIKQYPSESSQLSSLKSEEQIKKEIFEALVSEVTSDYYHKKLVIFVDEIERVKISGLGEYIKDNNLVQFVFIGIAKNIQDILSDHESAGRKLNGGNFLVPLLSDEEILWIFKNAASKVKESLVFSNDYLEEAVKYCGGMPWIAQHVGHNSVFDKILSSNEGDVLPHVLDKNDFQKGVEKAIEIYEGNVKVHLDFAAIEATQLTGVKVLEAIWQKTSGATVDEIIELIQNPNMNRWVERVLVDLEEANILVKIGKKYYYYDPVVRIFVKHHLEFKVHDGNLTFANR